MPENAVSNSHPAHLALGVCCALVVSPWACVSFRAYRGASRVKRGPRLRKYACGPCQSVREHFWEHFWAKLFLTIFGPKIGHFGGPVWGGVALAARQSPPPPSAARYGVRDPPPTNPRQGRSHS